MVRTSRLRTAAVTAAAVATAGLVLTTVPAQAVPSYGTATVTVIRTPSPAPHLVGIRTGRHATFDRLVLDLNGAAPGYKVGYVKVVRHDASGRVIDMRGNYFIMVRLTPADAHTSNGTSTYTGPHKFWVGYPELRQVAFAGDFEGVVSIGLGLRPHNGFRVFTLHDPTRIVVDIQH